MKTIYKEWTLIPWDGNLELNYQCWRKSFNTGHVSIGVGEFKLVVFSYGANSDRSFSSTRWRDGLLFITEEDAKQIVDSTRGGLLFLIQNEN